MTTKKLCLIALTLILAAATLCAGGAKENAAAAGTTTIQFWTWRPEDVDFYNKMIAQFEKQNPGIKVVQTAQKNTEYNTILAAALQGGSGPDVFQTRAYGGLQTFTDSGYIEPIEQWVPEVKNFSATALRGATSTTDKVVYGVPSVGQTLFVFYNKAMYDKLGLKVPETWEQFLANCEAMKKAHIVPIADGTKEGWIVELLMGIVGPQFYGANTFFDDVVAGKTTFTDPRFVEALTKMNDLKPYMPPLFTGVSYTDMQSSFINEMSGHFLGGSFEAGYFMSQNPTLKFDIFPCPGPKASDAKYVSVYADMNFSMNKASKNKEASAKFMQFLASKPFADAMINDLKMVSFTPGADASKDPFIAKVLQLQKNSTPYIFLVGFRYQQPTGSSLLQAAGQGMYNGTLTPAQVAQQIQAGIATYYKPFQK